MCNSLGNKSNHNNTIPLTKSNYHTKCVCIFWSLKIPLKSLHIVGIINQIQNVLPLQTLCTNIPIVCARKYVVTCTLQHRHTNAQRTKNVKMSPTNTTRLSLYVQRNGACNQSTGRTGSWRWQIHKQICTDNSSWPVRASRSCCAMKGNNRSPCAHAGQHVTSDLRPPPPTNHPPRCQTPIATGSRNLATSAYDQLSQVSFITKQKPIKITSIVMIIIIVLGFSKKLWFLF